MSLTNINFFNKMSASPTNIYFADYNGNGIEEKVVMKVYVDFIDSYKNSDFFEKLKSDYKIDQNSYEKAWRFYYNYYKKNIDGLNYEKDVYRFVIKNIIDNNYSPNFVEFVDFKTYNLEDFVNFVDQSTYTPKQKLYKFIETINGLKEITCCLDDNISDGLYKHILSNFNVICLITKEPKNIVTLGDILDLDLDKTKINLDNEEIYKIFFQLIYNLTLMDIIKIQHNDLHPGNILIERLDNPVDLYYIIDDNEKIKIKTKYIVRIFDWDLAYISDYLKNNKLDDVNNNYINNMFIKSYDLAKLFTFLDEIRDFENEPPNYYKSEINKKIFCEAISKGILKYQNYTLRFDGGTYMLTKEFTEQLDRVGDIIFSPVFDQFIYNSDIPSNSKIYRLPKEGEFMS